MDISLLLPLLIALLFIPIFLSGRRQRRQMQEMQALQSALTPGDEVMTTSGLRATVVDTSDEDTVELEIAPGITTIWMRAAVREKLNPVEDEYDADAEDSYDESLEDDYADGVEDGAKATDEDAVVNQGSKSDDGRTNGRP